MQVEQYFSDDYAGLESGRYSFYYGYEVTDGDEWCFIVKEKGNVVFKQTTSQINKSVNSDLDRPNDYLLAGIGIWLLLK